MTRTGGAPGRRSRTGSGMPSRPRPPGPAGAVPPLRLPARHRSSFGRAWAAPLAAAAGVPACPGAWFIGCGAAIPYAAKALPRPPAWMRRAGLAWLFRLFNEPRRLFRRYLVHDLPFAIRLLTSAAAGRFRRGHSWLGSSCQERTNA
jgi:hypothetical protein